MKYVITIAALVLAISPAFAEQFIRADVPFAFTAGRVRMPPGPCVLQIDGQGIVTLRHSEGGPAGFVLSHGVTSRSYPKTAELVFHKYGDAYFLSQIWAPGTLSGRELSVTPPEREMAQRIPVQKVVVARAASK